MLPLLSVKLLSVLALTIGLNAPAAASELKAVAHDETSVKGNIEYRIDSSARSVVTEWSANDPSAYLIAVHGFGLHKGAFNQFASAMRDRGVTTYALDVRGFGGWEAEGKQSLDFGKTFEDLDALIALIREEHPLKPIFLVGESMGGAIALDYSAHSKTKLDGVISSVPANDRFGKIRTAFAVGTSYILTGGNRINLKNILVRRVFHSKQLQQNWQSDPDSKLKFRLGDLIALTKFMRKAEYSATRISSVPVLMVQGERDRLVNPKGTERIFSELRTADKELLERPQGEHLTFEDGQFDDRVVSDVESWIAKHSGAPILSASAR